MKVTVGWSFGALTGQVEEIEILARQGETVRTEINPGSGIAAVVMQVTAIGPWFELRPQTGFGRVEAFFLVP